MATRHLTLKTGSEKQQQRKGEPAAPQEFTQKPVIVLVTKSPGPNGRRKKVEKYAI